MGDWNPDLYLRYADQRGRPFIDLVARIGATDPATVVDLGCGPGNLTSTLTQRWPGSRVLGVDSSAAMIDRARTTHGDSDRLRWQRADLRDWQPGQPVDVIVSNATLQWIPEHQGLLPRLVGMLAPGGWLAYQVPINFDEPSHRLLREVAADPRFAGHVEGVARTAQYPTVDAVAVLTALGCTVDAWETTYLHLLPGPDPVFEWISGTGARPILDRLPEPLRAEFSQAYKEKLRIAYPAQDFGTVLRFPRAFVVAQRTSTRAPRQSG
ncbi:trans-aconitate 2-methyltransferase [Propionibacteriaceae bacterium ES.041]|nr:trans-aconitate 2-methyltransferase [Propionibacteriaceae bacterium ES.041]